MKKIMTSWIVCVLCLVGLLAWLGDGMLRTTPLPSDGSGIIKADFTLQSGDGKIVSAQNFHGKYMLVYFGFSHCPDICPTTLLLMNNALEQLGDEAKKIQPIFISVDPERDTPKAASDYAGHFGKNFIGLSGSPAQIQHAADNFKVYYSKVEDKDSALGYVVDHSGFIYLMGPDGKYLTHFTASVSENELKKEMMRYVR